VKLVLLPFVEGRVFDVDPEPPPPTAELALRRELSRAQSLDQLLVVREEIVATQALRLEQALENEHAHANALERSQDALVVSEARSAAVVNNSLDAIISIDVESTVLGWNPAAETIFGYSADEAVGQDMAELIVPPNLRSHHRAGIVHYLQTGEAPALGQRVELVGQTKHGTQFPVELTITRVDLPGPATFTGFVRDITSRVLAEQAIEETRTRSLRIAQTLQQSLLPPSLPTIEGVELASRFRPAGDGSELGGDFFDIFQTGRDDWGFVLGDVCGKGAQAAALTALVRYTVRATAMRVRKPSAVLGVANEAINRQHPDTFCTAVYGRLRRTTRGLRCTLASGGHPLPIVRRSTGEVAQPGSHGRLLGPFDDAELHDFHIDIHVGDVVVLMTDGVTEARRAGGPELGEEGVMRLLATTDAASAADIAETIEAAALEHAGGVLKDDVAILVLRRTA
jgi:sigma-B regulation protein RsbU (phosphoserine phosphatase)